MSHIQPITHWRGTPAMGASYEKLLLAMGTEELGDTAREAVFEVTAGAQRLYLIEVQSRSEAELRYFSAEPELRKLISIYDKCYLPIDPVHEAFRAAPRTSDMVLQRVHPGDIGAATFRRRFFDDAGIIERVSIIQHAANGWRVMNVARHEREGYFSDIELEGLIGLACLVLPMLRMTGGAEHTTRQLTVPQLEARFTRRCPDLTARERQVCARAAIGMNVEATALDLGIAKTSVLTYRHRAYARLRVTSPYELSSLVSH